MPIYEYSCDECGHDLEALQGLNDEPLVDCPDCGRPTLRKRISAAAFRLKGGGWYETDFKSGKKRNVAGEGDGSGKSGSGDSGSGSGSGSGDGKSGGESKSGVGESKSSGSGSSAGSGSGGSQAASGS